MFIKQAVKFGHYKAMNIIICLLEGGKGMSNRYKGMRPAPVVNISKYRTQDEKVKESMSNSENYVDEYKKEPEVGQKDNGISQDVEQPIKNDERGFYGGGGIALIIIAIIVLVLLLDF